jgi:hypothetical protein
LFVIPNAVRDPIAVAVLRPPLKQQRAPDDASGKVPEDADDPPRTARGRAGVEGGAAALPMLPAPNSLPGNVPWIFGRSVAPGSELIRTPAVFQPIFADDLRMTDTRISLDTTVVASDKQVAADLEDEVVILSLAEGEYFGLNAVAAKIWAAIQSPSSVAEVRDHLLREYPDAEPEQCTEDTMELLEEMLQASIIEIVAEAGE